MDSDNPPLGVGLYSREKEGGVLVEVFTLYFHPLELSGSFYGASGGGGL